MDSENTNTTSKCPQQMDQLLSFSCLKQRFNGSKVFAKVTFPYHIYNQSLSRGAHSSFSCHMKSLYSDLLKIFRCPTVYAASEADKTNKTVGQVTPNDVGGGESMKGSASIVPSPSFDQLHYSNLLEQLARAEIKNETGMERVRNLFKKDHKGNGSPEFRFIAVVLVQTFVITFFLRYFPAYRDAREEFISQHRATVFKTRADAIRRMQDQVSLKAVLEGGKLACRITFFATSFLMMSQLIASYRNKSSIWEYTLGAGLTGGLFRFHIGPKAFVGGLLVGGFLGSIVGCVSYAMLTACNLTQESRHLQEVIAKLEVEKTILGEKAFNEKLAELSQGAVEGQASAL